MASVRVEEIEEGIHLLRVDDPYTGFFEALWEIPEGITYNAYLIRTQEGAVLVDGWKEAFASRLVEELESLVEPGELRYIVLNHLEPDHTGSLPAVAKWAPGARILATGHAARMLRESMPWLGDRVRVVRDGEAVELGGERLVFIHTPWLHWPETMVTWLPGRRVLMSCDVFGGYGIPLGVFDDECTRPGEALRSLKKYVVTVIGHYRQWIARGLSKLREAGVEPRVIAPGHGLLWRSNVAAVVEAYRRLAAGEPEEGKVLVLYASMYGSMERLARSLACSLARRGLRPVLYGYTDTGRPSLSELLTDAAEAEALVVLSPTYEAGVFPLLRWALEEICWKTGGEGRKAVVVAGYGWGGATGRELEKTLRGCGYRVEAVLEHRGAHPASMTPGELRRLAEEVASALQRGQRG